ncbi:MAG: hypothetical protein ACLSAH_20860 [Bilophila wadsworthia]
MEKAQKAFQAVATAGTALKLTTDQMNRLNLAVSQVISKGRPMAEEMRQQIRKSCPAQWGCSQRPSASLVRNWTRCSKTENDSRPVLHLP